VSVNDCLVWYLRASSPEEKQRWVDVLKSYKVIVLNVIHDMKHNSKMYLISMYHIINALESKCTRF
jgi:hypothetical protein